MMDIPRIWKQTLLRYKNTTPAGETTRHKLSAWRPTAEDRKYTTTITVENADTVQTAIDNPGSLLLNMANDVRPGGWPDRVGAQEEDLFRRSDLHKHLLPALYPIRDNEVLLSTKVQVHSAGMRKLYTEYPTLQEVDIISCPGIKNTCFGTELGPTDAKRLERKIHALCQAAYKGGYKTLVLSALGCGGFRCPPEHVSRIFKRVLNVYDGCFEQVIFAIWDQNYPKCNYRVFKETLQPT